MNIVNVGYKATNYFVIGDRKPKLLLDAGWPGTLPMFLATLKRMDVALESIGYVLATHYHPDHAGLAQELKTRGLKLIVMETQAAAIPLLSTFVKPSDGYVEITTNDTLALTFAESRNFLKKIGIDGCIIATPGHSDDSVTLVLDSGAAFIGDLTPPFAAGEDDAPAITASWRAIAELGATTIYPGHGPVCPLPEQQ